MGKRINNLYVGFRETKWFDITLMIIKHFWNPSMLIMPNLFRNGGYLLSIAIYVLVGILMLYSTSRLSEAKAIVGMDKRRYTEDMLCAEISCYVFEGTVLGRIYEAVSKATEFLVHIGKSALYILISAKIMRNVYNENSGQPEQEVQTFLLLLAIPFLFLSVITIFRMWYRVCYTIGALLILIVMGKVTELVIVDLSLDHDQLDQIGEQDYIPICIALAFFSHSYLSPICNYDLKLKKKSQYLTLTIGWTVYALLSLGFGLLCYLALNEKTETIIVFNFYKTKTSLCLNIMTLFAVILMYGNEFSNCVTALLLDFENWSKLEYFSQFSVVSAKTVLNILLAWATWTVASLIPSIEILAALIGATSVLVLNICIPVLIYIIVRLKIPTICNTIVIVVHAALFALSVALFFYMNYHLAIQIYSYHIYFKFS